MFLRTIIIFTLLLFVNCTHKQESVNNQRNNIFNDTANFLAGLPVKNEALTPYIDDNFYPQYSAQIDKNWNEAFGLNREIITKWRSENLKPDYSLSVFYPFSGPDVLHPLTFYPKAKEITMFGLEPTGGIPDIRNVDPNEINQQLKLLSDALNFILDRAFFVTLDMEKKVKPSSLNGVSAIMIFFLARGGYDILNIREINITEDVNLAEGVSADRNAINGIEILFAEKGNKEVKCARYFTLDIVNTSRQVDKFDAYMRKHSEFTTIIKSASYLMHWSNFSKIRNLVLEVSDSIIQDDTGVPYSFFRNNSNWNVTHFGRYHRPIPVFNINYQKDLDEDNKRYSTVPIPFVYGYGYGYAGITYHLLLAEKVKKD